MLTAKLFTGLAIATTLYAWVLKHRAGPRVGLYFAVTHFAIAYVHLLLLFSLNCAVFAALYFAAARWMPNPRSQTLGLLHFAMMLLTIGLFVVVGFIDARHLHDAQSVVLWRQMYIVLADALCFLLSWAVFVGNLGWAVVRAVRVQ